MQPTFDFNAAESLSGIWSALHNDVDIAVSENEVHYLRATALAADDDLVSSLLLKKLKLATRLEASRVPSGLVVMNSYLEYSFDGGAQRFVQLLHPSPHRGGYGVSIASLLGVGLLGLRTGQAILWPDALGSLCDLHVGRVENCPGLTGWLGSPGR